MGPVGRPRKDERPATDPSEILARAADLFAARGYRATSLVHVANELGITRQALYHYFPSKQAILLALLDRILDLLESETDADEPGADAPPVARLYALAQAHARVVATHVSLVRLLLHEQAELNAAGHAAQLARYDRYRRRFADLCEAGVAAGVMRAVDGWTAATTIVSALDALATWYRPDENQTPGEAAALAADLALTGVVLAAV